MSFEIEIVPPTHTLEDLQRRLVSKEAAGFELVTLARGLAGSQAGMLAIYRRCGAGTAPTPLTLRAVSGSLTLTEQPPSITAGETPNRRLISYAAVLVGGQETNVAVYRG
jgi:hypothetical protein